MNNDGARQESPNNEHPPRTTGNAATNTAESSHDITRFVQKQESRAALGGREKMVMIPSPLDYLTGATVSRISLTSSEYPIAIEDSTDLICPIEGNPHLRAFCDELWLVEAENSPFLWNQSMRTCRKLPDSLLPTKDYRLIGFVYGLDYDSAADDYKILKIVREDFSFRKTELYSLKSNSWKKIRPLSRNSMIEQHKCEFVNGAFHWMCTFRRAIASFDLSTEKYGEVPKPEYSGANAAEVVVLRGKLCVCANYPAYYSSNGSKFIMWVMEEYGVDKSWTKKFDIEYSISSIPCLPIEPRSYKSFCTLRPLYFYDKGDILFNISCNYKN